MFIDEGKGGVLHLVSHFISSSNIFYTKPDKKRTLLRHNIRHVFLVKWTGWRMVVTILYTDCIYRRILKFFQTSSWILLIFKWFFLWVSQSFMSLNIRHRNCVFMCIFLCLSVRNVVYTHVCTADSRVQVWAIRVGPYMNGSTLM